MTSEEAKKFGLIDSVVEKEGKILDIANLQLRLDNIIIEFYIRN